MTSREDYERAMTSLCLAACQRCVVSRPGCNETCSAHGASAATIRAYVAALEARPDSSQADGERLKAIADRDAEWRARPLSDEVAEAVEASKRVCEVMCFLLPKGTFTPEHRDEVYRPLSDMSIITRALRGEE